ncbi:helix-turn-helix domain-containing protein [Streptomyces olivaceiscleroticus]
MMAIHWAADPKAKRYTPSSSHGPKAMNHTTLRIAQELANLKVCRPGVAYLMRKLKLSERSVEYHLGMLREAGLLVYRTKGTRVSGAVGQASVFERVIPVAYDEAHGIRTVGEGVQRRQVGAAQEARSILGKLSKKAARKVRKPRSKTASKRGGRCTLMQGGTSGLSSAGSTTSPSESKLASGKTDSPTPKSTSRPRRVLNKVGRRHQLAKELIQQEPWLGTAAVPRIAWVVRHVADAGWSATEVRAFLHHCASHRSDNIRRPSAVLATRLRAALTILRSAKDRQECVEAWRESQVAAQQRHNPADWQDLGPGPRSAVAQRELARAQELIRQRKAVAVAPSTEADGPEIFADSPAMALEDLSRAEVLEMRAAAAHDPSVIGLAIELIGETQARRLYTNAAVNRFLADQETANV